MRNVIDPTFDYDVDEIYLSDDMSNKLFCTFSREDELDDVIYNIKSSHKIIYSKIFILHSKEQDEYICTYNVEAGNISGLLDNTVLVHRKKKSNTLYTINALNALIRNLNGGRLDTSYMITWEDYQNCLLLTKGSELRQLNTSLFKILEL